MKLIYKHLYIYIYANVCFWDVFVIFCKQSFILQEMWFVDLCVKFWKKEAKFWKCVSNVIEQQRYSEEQSRLLKSLKSSVCVCVCVCVCV